MSRLRIVVMCRSAIALFAMLQLAACSTAQVTSSVKFEPIGIPASVRVTGVELPNSGFEWPVRYFVRNPGGRGRTAMIFIGGSGCSGAFSTTGGRASASLEAVPIKENPDVLVAVIDKPGIPRQYSSAAGGVSDGCPLPFLRSYDFTARVRYVRAAIDHIVQTYRPSSVQVIGTSDGALYAAAVAASAQDIGFVTLISGFSDEAIHLTLSTGSGADLVKSLRQWESIEANPNEVGQFAFGHPYLRWSTLLGESAARLILKAPRKMKVYVVHGLKDKNAPPESFTAGLAVLVSGRRDFMLSVIDCGDHSLVCPADNGEPVNLMNIARNAVAIQSGQKPTAFPVSTFSFANR